MEGGGGGGGGGREHFMYLTTPLFIPDDCMHMPIRECILHTADNF